MAKVGNETKLVVTLFKERIKRMIDDTKIPHLFTTGLLEARNVLNEIIAELEEGR